MIKVALLIGAYKNAGDFLIAKRAKELIESVAPSAEITVISRSKIIERLQEINSCNVIAFSGGPIYLNDINNYLNVEDINSLLKKPVMIIGGGWNGISGFSQVPYKYEFEKKTRDFFQRVDNDYGLACRDVYTIRTLKKENYHNIFLTGCPAWYDIRFVNLLDFRNKEREIQSITISDPALKGHIPLVEELIYYLKTKYPKAEITMVFHRGIDLDSQLYSYLKKNNVDMKDISNNCSGFAIYDNCDLHIGFRVHAHIYNLSMRNKSILIEEDGRGAGVNQTLGLIPIRAYSDKLQSVHKVVHRGIQKLGISDNPYLIQEIDDYITCLEQTDYWYIKNAFSMMLRCYKNMFNYIKKALPEEI